MKSLKHLNKYFLKYKWHFLLGILFTIISNYFGVRMPLFVKSTVDSLMSNVKIDSINDALLVSLKIGGIYMLLSIAKGFFLFLMRQTIIVMSRHIEYDLKNEIYNQYQNLDLSFYKKNNTGDLMNRISEDVSHVRMYLGPGVMYSINLVVLFTLVVYQMIAISPVLTALVLIPLPIMSYLIYKVSAKMNLLSKKVQEEQSLLSTIAQESFSGMRVIKAYSQQKSVGDKFENAANMYKSKSMRLVVVNALFIPTILFLIGLSTLLSIYIGGNMSFNNEISLGGIVAFIFFVNNLTWPFASIGWVTSLIQRAAASQQRINEFLSVKTNTNEVIEDTLFKFENEISFNNVSYTYQNTGIHAIKNISFVIPKGETFAIIGKTGSGKSTILSLLLRQLNPNSGAIKLDTCNFDKIETNGFKNALGVVPQEVFLFSDSIGNNIKFGSNNPIVSKERLDEVCETADILNTINKLEDGYETILGERGVNLSGGQKQRLSIARALLRSPEILVLDDCLSAVDTETEDKILKELQKEKTSRTTIIVSHRISTIRNAKHIIVIDDGSVIEQGSHAVLLKNKGFYYDLYKKQQTDLKNNEDRKKPL
ncbi:MAG: ABC transporter ATP-binding protein/permease [Crocinitomicaceae bacterium]|nr:ABC transporter ATP-binding protein/permease [Crocinitomicaceae bacterium]